MYMYNCGNGDISIHSNTAVIPRHSYKRFVYSLVTKEAYFLIDDKENKSEHYSFLFYLIFCIKGNVLEMAPVSVIV